MTTIDCLKLRTSGAFCLERIIEAELQVGANRHGYAFIIGEAGENAFEKLNGAVAGQEMRVWTLEDDGSEVPLFSGVIDTATLVSVGGYNRFQIELSSGTSLMDRQKRNRSFQNVNQTYEQIVEQVVSAYAGGFAICTIGCDAPIGTPLIQYGETDWEFLMRIASQLGGVLVPEVSRGLPRMWFGFPDRSYECTFPEHCYTSGLSQRFFENGGEAAGLRREDYFYYDVESPENCDIGWYTYFKGDMFLISEKSAILKKGEFLFTYRLGRSGLGFSLPRFNDKISGMSLLGEVVSTSAETVSLRLDIDKGHDPGGAYPYPWRPATGTLMYCMPQAGTRVSLYFPTLDERRAMVVNCVRTNGESCERMGDPSKRAFVTEHGKELTLHPEEMSLMGGIGQLLMSDADGIKLSSDGDIQIVGTDVRFEAPTVTCSVPKGELIMAKTDVVLETAESSFSMSNAYQMLAESNTAMEGSDLETFEPYADQPEEGKFEWGKLLGNVLAGLAVVALVAVAVFAIVATGGLAAVGIGAAAAGSMATAAAVGGGIAVGMVAIGDIASGEVSDVGAYMSAGFSGAVTGAAFAGLGLAGQALGQTIKCLSTAGKVISVTAKISGGVSVAMGGFDLVSFVGGLLFPGNPLTDLNQKLHSNALYNGFQMVVSALAVFTGGAASTMKCFVAGTMILTSTGLVAIENIRAEDKVISTDAETFEVAEKTVLETYIRNTTELINLTVNGELIQTTLDHPFYVKNCGFVNACKLRTGDELLDSAGNILHIENTTLEICKQPVPVYNFQVEDFHTYHVGYSSILVHNANCRLIPNDDGTYDVELSYKEDWTPEQRMEADLKVEALSGANTVKTQPNRQGSASSVFKSANGPDSVKSFQDVDHTIDLQLGGADDIMNMNPLDRSVNRSLGSQIQHLINKLPFGTVFGNFTIH